MFHIELVEIDGFWEKHKIRTKFYPDANIFIGKNGTGKTTFMNLLQAALRADLEILQSLDFTKITIRLSDYKRIRTISITRENTVDEPFETAIYKIGRRKFTVPLVPRDPAGRRFRMARSLREQYSELKEQIGSLVNVSSLSVHRIAYDAAIEEDYFLPRTKRKIRRSPIDERLEELINDLTSYQLSLAEKANEVSSKFQKEVLVSMLYDEKFDNFEIEKAWNIELSKEKDELSKAYKELGAWDKKISKKIEEHVAALNRSLDNIRIFKDGEDSYTINLNDILPIPLLRRTQHIINLSLDAEKQKQSISRPIRQFVQLIGDFMEDKSLQINPSNGEITVKKGKKDIDLFDLSSGEKQLLILLVETLLQKNQPFIFLADEPEISLHIEWQAKVISSIRQLNFEAQVIVATHSPEIAGSWKGNVINMEDIISE
ncbi:AAA family ATPase [candidate division KSB1 bacterium]|nr:AAA family ATPase [candidate division KSB1 bacterium]